MAEWKTCTVGELCKTISETYKGDDEKVVLINTSDVLDGKRAIGQKVCVKTDITVDISIVMSV